MCNFKAIVLLLTQGTNLAMEWLTMMITFQQSLTKIKNGHCCLRFQRGRKNQKPFTCASKTIISKLRGNWRRRVRANCRLNMSNEGILSKKGKKTSIPLKSYMIFSVVYDIALNRYISLAKKCVWVFLYAVMEKTRTNFLTNPTVAIQTKQICRLNWQFRNL